jgi:hypothetical protein
MNTTDFAQVSLLVSTFSQHKRAAFANGRPQRLAIRIALDRKTAILFSEADLDIPVTVSWRRTGVEREVVGQPECYVNRRVSVVGDAGTRLI